MSSFDAFVGAFHDHFTRNPNDCVGKGVDRRLGDLPDPSRATEDDEVAEARRLRTQAAELHERERDFDRRLDLELAALLLDREIHQKTFEFNAARTGEQQPRAAEDVGDAIFLMLVNDPRPAPERLDDLTARLEKVPDYTEALLDRLTTPVERWTRMDRERIAGLPALFDSIEALAHEVDWSDGPRLKRARASAQNALTSYSERLGKLETTKQLHAGEAVARSIVETRGIDPGLDELHRIARDFLERTGETLEALRQRLADKYSLPSDTTTTGLHEFLNRRFAVDVAEGDFDAVLDRYRRELGRVKAFVGERKLFPIFEDQTLEILQTPEFMTPTIPAGAMTSPPPFREGTRRSLVYLTLSDELLDEHTELGIPMMMVHEGIPGHHLQLATASKHPSVVRRHVDAMEQAEGWTTMLEDYMLDIGYGGELEDEIRFSAKRDISRIGARVGIDLFFMTGDKKYLELGTSADLSSDDPFEVAGNVLVEVTGFTPARAQTELNWYSQERGYPLSYLAGNHAVWELKRDVQTHLAGRDSAEIDQVFHQTFLDAGNMPVTFLRRVFQNAGLAPS